MSISEMHPHAANSGKLKIHKGKSEEIDETINKRKIYSTEYRKLTIVSESEL
jgi:hypothetical protein